MFQNYWLFSLCQFFYSCFSDALRDLVSFVQFKKREKHPWRSVTFSKVAGFLASNFTKSNTPPLLENGHTSSARPQPWGFSYLFLTPEYVMGSRWNFALGCQIFFKMAPNGTFSAYVNDSFRVELDHFSNKWSWMLPSYLIFNDVKN